MGLRKEIREVKTDNSERVEAKLHTRPLIVQRFNHMLDKEKAQAKLIALRSHNAGKSKNKRVFVTEHLPKKMDLQRKVLLPQCKKT